MIFSRIFKRKEERHMGWEALAWSYESLPGLGMKITLAVLHMFGMKLRASEALNVLVRIGRSSQSTFCRCTG
jgi:hypothetical protein